MSEQDLSSLLHDRLAETEPPLTIRADETVRRGRTVRRRRAGLAAGLVLAGLGGVVALALGGPGPSGSTPIATDLGAPSIDEAIAAAVTREYVPHLGALPPTPVTANDDQGNRLPLDAPGVTGVGVAYELPGGHSVTLGVHVADDTSITDCTEWERTGAAVACDVGTLADGSTVMTSVLAFGPPQGGAPSLRTILDADMRAAADPATLEWSHGVLVRTPDGDISAAYELLPAPSYDAAQAAWQLPEAAMRAAATDPALTGHDFD